MNKSKTIWTAIVGVSSSILAMLGFVSCCGLPILAGSLAVLGIGASQLSFFAEYQVWFMWFAILSILFGFYQVYFKKKSSCCATEKESSCCASGALNSEKSISSRFQKVLLWIGVVMIGAMLALRYNDQQILKSQNGRDIPESQLIKTEMEKEATPSNCCPR